MLFQNQRMPNIFIRLNDLLWQQLQFSMELGHTILRQQEQQIQTEYLVFVLRFTNLIPAMELKRTNN